VVEETNSGAKQNCGDVDGEFVQEPSIQALLGGISAGNPNRLPGASSFGLIDC
jgi:hypothetical protein